MSTIGNQLTSDLFYVDEIMRNGKYLYKKEKNVMIFHFTFYCLKYGKTFKPEKYGEIENKQEICV